MEEEELEVKEELQMENRAAEDNGKKCRKDNEDPGDQFYKQLTLQMQNNYDSCGAFGTLVGMKVRELDKSVHTVLMTRILSIVAEYEKN